MEAGSINLNDLTQRVIIGALLLLICAWAYNRWITALETNSRHQGFVSLLVVLGVGMVLVVGAGVLWGLTLPSILVLAVLAILFVAAGTPMIVGSIGRYIARREAEQRRADELARSSVRREE